MYWITLVFLHRGLGFLFQKTEVDEHIGYESKHVCFLSCSFWVLDPANDRNCPGYFDSRAEISVRIRKGCFMIETVWHSTCLPQCYTWNFVHIYIYIYISIHIYIYRERERERERKSRTGGGKKITISITVFLVPLGCGKKVVPAINVDTLRGQEKKRPPTWINLCCGKITLNTWK